MLRTTGSIEQVRFQLLRCAVRAVCTGLEYEFRDESVMVCDSGSRITTEWQRCGGILASRKEKQLQWSARRDCSNMQQWHGIIAEVFVRTSI